MQTNSTNNKRIESFPTIEKCVDHLKSIGCKWDSEKQQSLEHKSVFVYGNTLVFYDPAGLLDEPIYKYCKPCDTETKVINGNKCELCGTFHRQYIDNQNFKHPKQKY